MSERLPPRSWFVMGENEDDPRPALLVVLVHLSLARGHKAINQWAPEGTCFRVEIDDLWEAWINPHKVDGVFDSPSGMSGTVEPFTAWVNYNGWLWAMGDYEGQIFGDHPDPESANARSFVAAVVQAWPEDALDELQDPDGPMEGWI